MKRYFYKRPKNPEQIVPRRDSRRLREKIVSSPCIMDGLVTLRSHHFF